MFKSTRDIEVARLLDLADNMVAQEFERASKAGYARVHAFMREANFNVFNHPRPEIAIRAVFQQADREFRPEPLTVAEHWYGPANLEEALCQQEQ